MTDADRLARYDTIVGNHLAWRVCRTPERTIDPDALEVARHALHAAGKHIVDESTVRLLTYVYQDGQR